MEAEGGDSSHLIGTTIADKYKITEDAEVTVMLWKGQKAVVNHAFAKGKLDKEAVKAIVESTSKILE